MARDTDASASFLSDRGDQIFTASAGVSGTLAGLSVAAVAIVGEYSDRPYIRRRLSPGQRRALIGTFISAIWWLGVATVIALASLIASGTAARQVLLAGWLIAAVMSLGYVARAVSLLRVVLLAQPAAPPHCSSEASSLQDDPDGNSG